MAETLPIRLIEVNGHFEDPEKNVIERSELNARLSIDKEGINPSSGERFTWTDEMATEQARKLGVKYYLRNALGGYTLYMPR